MIIYCLTSPSGRRYVGQTVESRWRNRVDKEWQRARNGCTEQPALMNAMRAHPVRSEWKTESVWECDSLDMLNLMESHFILALDTILNGYNCKEGGGNGKHTAESRALMSKNRSGIPRKPEQIRKHREAMLGRKMHPNTAAALNRALTGKCRKGQNKGITRSAETRAKMSAAKKGKGKPWSALRRARHEAKKR